MAFLLPAITVKNKWLLRVFWAKRETYPASVTAHPSLWAHWFLTDPLAFFRRVKIEASPRKHGSRARRLGKDKRLDTRQFQDGFEI